MPKGVVWNKTDPSIRNPALLERLYVEDKLSTQEIASSLGVANVTILSWLREFGIPHRNLRRPEWTPELIKKLYWQEGLSTLEIGGRFNLSKSSIKDAMIRYGIPRRTRRECSLNAYRSGKFADSKTKVNGDQLYNLYWGQSFSIPQIARELKIGIDVVQRAMRDFKIPVRNRSEASRLRQVKGDKSPSWKGGKTKSTQGYNLIRQLEHPRAGKSGYVAEHILIWEEVHNKVLPEGWVIHHLNGIKDDNRPENLVAFSSTKHAHVLAAKGKRIRELEAKVKLLERALEQNQLIFNFGEN